MKFKVFFFANATATLLYVAVYMSIGIVFRQQLNNVLKKLSLIQHGIFITVMIVIAAFVIIKTGKYIYEKSQDNQTAQQGN
jgi:membrane protein DedA with SNARE-associated domain